MSFTTNNILSTVEVVEAGGDSVVREEGEQSRVTWKFIVRGATDASDAYDEVLTYLQTNFDDGSGSIASYNIPLDTIRITTTDSNFVYEAEVAFAYRNAVDDDVNDESYTTPEIEDFDYSFSTTGGTAHLNHSIATLGAATVDGSTPRSFGCGVGWNGESFDGVDVVAPKVEFTISVNFPKAYFTQAYRLTLANATGAINSAAWNGFGAGCVLFKGVTAKPTSFNYTDANGNSVKDWYWRATYSFEAAPATTFTVGSTTLTKRGFDYVWRVVEKTEDSSGQIIANVAQVNVEQVYPEFDFDLLGLPLPDDDISGS